MENEKKYTSFPKAAARMANLESNFSNTNEKVRFPK
jgi:hypothetical protein